LYFISRDVDEDSTVRWATGDIRTKDDGAKAEAAAAIEATAAMVNFIFTILVVVVDWWR